MIWDRANAIPVKDAYLAGYSGIDRSYFSRIRSGALNFSFPQFKTLDLLLTNLEELKIRSKGTPVDWSDISGVKRMLAELEDERRNPPAEPSHEDVDIFKRFIANEPLEEIAILYRVDRAEILRRVEQVNLRSEHLSRKAAVEPR